MAALAARRGIDGDQTGRVVWAELDWHAPASQQFMDGSPLVPQTSVAATQAEMNARYTDWLIWFGPWSGFWYGVPKDADVPRTNARRRLSSGLGRRHRRRFRLTFETCRCKIVRRPQRFP